jgi:serine/threonine protein kinase
MKDGSQALKEIGGYELISKIGQGGMGAVFKARQKSLDRVVALKVLPPSVAKDAKFIERFQREARACAKLNHPNIVQGVDVGKDDATGVWYFAMEFVDGPSVLKLLKSDGPMSEERALEIARDIAKALECAAGQGIVHRDIKPDNILLTENGDAKLADLGLARQMNADNASLTQSGQALGTPYYMAPEQVRGRSDQCDIRTDIYALGGTLFHMVAGQPPFSGETSAVIMSKHLTDAAPKASRVNPDVSEECSRLIERMMQKEREKRVQSPRELIEQIERVLRGETTGPKPMVKGAAVSRRKKEVVETPKSSHMPLILGGAALVVVIAVVALMRGGGGTPETKKLPESSVVAEVSQPQTPRPAPPANPAPSKEKKRPEPSPSKTAAPASASVKTETPIVDIVPPAVEPSAASTNPEPPVVPAPAVPAVAKATVVAEPKEKIPEAPAKVKVEAAKVPAVQPAAAPAAIPYADIFAALKENAPKKAVERVSAQAFAGKDALVEALTVLDTQRETRQAAIQKLIGQNVKLDSVKGAQNGKMVAFKNGVLQLERAIMINGEARGSTQVNVPMDELLPATLERIAPIAAPAAPADWIAATLVAMSGGQLDAADAALGHVAGHELQGALAAEIKATRVRERESQAKAAWAKIETRATEAPSQTKAKQLLDDLTAFAKKFSDSDFAANPEIVAKMLELKEKFDRLSLGLDPRVLQLFKGKVLSYDARTQVITLGYDLLTKEQTEDFVESTWAPPGDTTGLTWRKGELRTFCKGTADRVFRMPQFASGSLNIQLHFKKIDTSRRNRFEVEVSFYGLDSTGKTPKVSFKASEKACHLIQNGGDIKTTDDILFRADGVLELSCQGGAYSVKQDNKLILEHTLPKPNDHSGFWLGGGWDSGITFTRMQISGRLDQAWLAGALAGVPKGK